MAYESIANYDYRVIFPLQWLEPPFWYTMNQLPIMTTGSYFPYNDWNPPIDIPCLNNEWLQGRISIGLCMYMHLDIYGLLYIYI